MRIDTTSLAFGYQVLAGGANPNWATALGQGKEHKINIDSSIDELLRGMVYCSVSLEKISTKIGKGGKFVSGADKDSPILIGSVFNKIYVNNIFVPNGKFILIVTRDTSDSHAGRLRLKYGPSNTFNEGAHSYTNADFYDNVVESLGIAHNACWFVSDISILEQNEVHINAIIVNATGPEVYPSGADLHAKWDKLISEADYEVHPSNNFELTFTTNINCGFERNRIVFGAPGTGKSYQVEEDRKKILEMGGGYERVTFHPDYTYSNFVGCYKPVSNNGQIDYKYVPGPFMRVLVEALRSGMNDPVAKPYLLVIEEINRAKVAAVFGEVFQLLDRDVNGTSDYEIHTSEDVKKWLADQLHGSVDNFDKIRIPNNMFIWATMNSADQGVFPMDTAFKRRWSFEYKGIDENEDKVGGNIVLGKGEHALKINWNILRKAINEALAKKYNVNEDKLLGPFFIDEKVFDSDNNGDIKEPAKFIQVFKSKVIMYLYEDAAKQHKHKLFSGCDSTRYSSICNAFDEIGVDIFPSDFREIYNEMR